MEANYHSSTTETLYRLCLRKSKEIFVLGCSFLSKRETQSSSMIILTFFVSSFWGQSCFLTIILNFYIII